MGGTVQAPLKILIHYEADNIRWATPTGKWRASTPNRNQRCGLLTQNNQGGLWVFVLTSLGSIGLRLTVSLGDNVKGGISPIGYLA